MTAIALQAGIGLKAAAEIHPNAVGMCQVVTPLIGTANPNAPTPAVTAGVQVGRQKVQAFAGDIDVATLAAAGAGIVMAR